MEYSRIFVAITKWWTARWIRNTPTRKRR